jgi:hypothetical protein
MADSELLLKADGQIERHGEPNASIFAASYERAKANFYLAANCCDTN